MSFKSDIINRINHEILNIMTPVLNDYENNTDIINDINNVMEKMPKYKLIQETNDKFIKHINKLENENLILTEKISNLEKILFKLINQSYDRIHDKSESNYGYWYEGNDKNNINVYIIDYNNKHNDKNENNESNLIDVYKKFNKILKDQQIDKIQNEDNQVNEDDNDDENEDDNQDNENETYSYKTSNEDEENEDEENEDEENKIHMNEELEENKSIDCYTEEDDNEVFEKSFNNKKYYVTDHLNGCIYEFINSDEVGKKIGFIKNGIAFF